CGPWRARELDKSLEASLGAGVQLQVAVVCRGDRGDDREAEPDAAVARGRAIGREAAEWLRELRDVGWVEALAPVFDQRPGATGLALGLDPNPAACLVWRIALSRRLPTMRASSVSLPRTLAWASVCSTVRGGGADCLVSSVERGL